MPGPDSAKLWARVAAVALAAFAAGGCSGRDADGDSAADASTTTTAAVEEIEVELSGKGAVPAGDPDGTGTALVRLDVEGGEVCVVLDITDVGDALIVHLQRGTPTEVGPVIAVLPRVEDGHADGCVDIDSAIVAEIEAEPGLFFIVVRTTDSPQGALVGQLGDPPTTTTEPGAPKPPPTEPDAGRP